MTSLFLTLLACGGPEAPKAPEAKLEDYMRTCMGDGDCTTVSTGCCDAGMVAVNKSSAQKIKAQALSADQCAAIECAKKEAPKVSCEAAKCVLAK